VLTPVGGPPDPGLPVRAPSGWLLAAAFGTVYLVWGSTYLAIRFAIETLPPFLMAGVRFLVAGTLLYGWARIRTGAPAPTRAQWRSAAVVGVLLLVTGNGAVVWAQQWVHSGLVALLAATVPLWLVLLDWLGWGARRPGLAVVAGLALGLLGVAALAGAPEIGREGMGMAMAGVGVVLVGAVSWAAGSLLSRSSHLPPSPSLAASAEMLAGGAALLAVGLVAGELSSFEPAAVSTRSLGALAYLIVFGSLLALSAYLWLLRVSTPSRVSTYAYVNPLVAMVLGWALAGEPLTTRTLGAAALILAGVLLITARR
jgi:drug/metabolite transporter (DMT)-like permease